MASIQYKKNKKGVLVARIQVSGKDPHTGKFKIYPRTISNEDGLTEAKFKKKINLLAAQFEEEIATACANQMEYIHTAVLTFSELAAEWIRSIDAHQSHNYYIHAKNACTAFNDYLKSIGLDKKPIVVMVCVIHIAVSYWLKMYHFKLLVGIWDIAILL